MRPDKLASQYPELVQIKTLGHEGDWGPIRFRTIYRGQLEERESVAHPNYPLCVASYRQSGAVGRHSSLLGPDNTLVAEDGYHLSEANPVRKLPLGKFNPLYWRYRWQGDLRNRGWLPAPQSIQGTAVVLNNPWCHNYYHWMLEVVPRIMLMQRAGLSADWFVIECQSRYQQRVLELLGVPRERWIQPHFALNLRADTLLRPGQPGSDDWRELSAALKRNLNATADRESQPARRRIYISRKSASHRKLANERELEQVLSRYGFESHCFEHCDFAQQVELLHNAEAVVAVHGAALANLIFAQPGTQVVEICPVNRYNADCFPRISRKMGLEHVTVMAESTRCRQNLKVDLNDLQAAFDLIGLAERPRQQADPTQDLPPAGFPHVSFPSSERRTEPAQRQSRRAG